MIHNKIIVPNKQFLLKKLQTMEKEEYKNYNGNLFLPPH